MIRIVTAEVLCSLARDIRLRTQIALNQFADPAGDSYTEPDRFGINLSKEYILDIF